MLSINSNIQYKSNVYIVSSSYSPYDDSSFIHQVYDAKKLNEIIKKSRFGDVLLTKVQRYILEKDVVCIYAKKFLKSETAQYFILTRHNEEKCKCQIVDCPLFEQCRPNEKIKAQTEQERFNNLSIAEKIDNTHYYPIMLNFDRVIERCSDNAFDVISDIDMTQYQYNDNVTFSYVGDGNGANWDNWVGGSEERYFSSEKKTKNILVVDLTSDIHASNNPMLEYQKRHLNLDNEFFKKIQKGTPT